MNQRVEETKPTKWTTVRSDARERCKRFLPSVVACGLWMTVSTLTILENKRTMSVLGFSYPMATSAMGMCFSAAATWTLHLAKQMQCTGRRNRNVQGMATRGALIGALSAASLYFGNVPYLYLSVSYIQMLKSLTPATTLMLAMALKTQKGTYPLYLSMCLITIGAGLTSVGEVHANAYGTALFMLSILSEAGRVVGMQILLKDYNLSTMETLMFTSTGSALFLGIGTLLTEGRRLVKEGGLQFLQSHPIHFLYLSSLGFLTNVTTLLVIRVTSPLTLKVVAQLKSVLTILLGVALYGDVVTMVQTIGYVLSVGGILLYNMQAGRATPTMPKTS